VGVDGRTRVADFGIARALYRRSHTSTGELKGKFAYFSPEQARGEDVDRRADVFALGIVAWEAVTGAKLFAGDDALRTLRRVAEEEIPDPRSRRPDLPGEAAGAILRALLRDPRERWQTAGDMATALRNAARGLGPTPSARAIGRWVAEVGADRVRAIRDGIDVALGAADAAEEIDVEAEAPTHVSSGVAARSSPDTRSAAVPPGTAAAPKPRLALDSQPSVTETAGALVSPPPGKPAPARAAAVGIGAAVIVAAVFLLGRASREAAPGSGSAALPPSAEPVAAASASASSAPPASAPAAASSAVDPAAVGSGKPSTKPAGSARVAADARPSVDARAAPSAVAATSSAPAAPPPPTSAPAATQAPAPPPKPVDTPPQPGGPLLGDDAFTRDLSRKH
jgi:serine/threonine-protein kinase